MKQLIEDGWMSLEKASLSHAGAMQRRECRKFFYAGACHVFYSVLRQVSPGDDVQQVDIEMMDAIDQELQAFGASLANELTTEGHG